MLWLTFLDKKRKAEQEQRWSKGSDPLHHYLAQIVWKLDSILDSSWFRKNAVNADIKDFLLGFKSDKKTPEQVAQAVEALNSAKPMTPKKLARLRKKAEIKEKLRKGKLSKMGWLGHFNLTQEASKADAARAASGA